MQLYKRFICFSAALSALLGLTIFGPAAQAAPNYTATDLGALTSGISQANGLNSTATVVGFSDTSSGMFDGFSWSSGTMLDLGLLSGGTFSEGFGVNDAGTIVGTSSDLLGNFHALAWQGGKTTDLGFLPGGNQAVAMAINANGVIAGYAYDSNSNSHAVIWTPMAGSPVTYSMTDLGMFSGVSAQAVAINNSGMVVGTYVDASGNSHGFLWNAGTKTDLGDLGGGESFGEAINSSGAVVGQAMTSGGGLHAFMWVNGQMTDLGALDGIMSGAFGINDSDQIVGESSSSDGTTHAVMWEGSTTNDLGSFVGMNSFADAINASGQIVGQGTFGNFSHGFLLTPVITAPPVNPPVTTVTLQGRVHSNTNWYIGPVTVRLRTTDTGGPGVASTFYTIDGGAQQTYSGTFTISGDGIHTLMYWSVDVSGNAETPKTADVKIDTTPPVTTDSISGNLTGCGWYTGTVTITMNATDATSGVAVTDTVLDFWHLFQGNSTFTVSTTGRHSLLFTSRDVAGNEEPLHYVTFNVDNTPPAVVAVDSVQSLGKGNWQITIWGYADDYASGIAPMPPSFTVSDSSGPLSPTAVTNTMRSGHFVTQFNVFLPSTVPPASSSASGNCANGSQSSSSGHDHVSVALTFSDNAGNTVTKTVIASM